MIQEVNLYVLEKPVSFFHKKEIFRASGAYHRHNGYEIYFILSGNVNFYVEQNCIQPEAGSIILLNPAEMHRVQFLDDSPYERFVINLESTYADTAFPQKLLQCFFHQAGIPSIRTLSAREYQEYSYLIQGLEFSQSPDCFDGETAQSAYLALILEFINRVFRTQAGMYQNIMPFYITGTMQYIENHLCDDLSLSVLADMVHISKNYLSAQFKYHTGLTLRHYILDRKLFCARKMLKAGASVTDACFSSGFNNYANFERSFKNYTGISPGKYGR